MINRKNIKNDILIIYYWILCILLNPKNRGLNPYEDAPIKRWLTQNVKGNHNSAVRLIVSGEVIDSSYKGWLKRKALARELQCRMRTRFDGKIEAIIVGDGRDIEDVVLAAWKGNKRSKIEKVLEFWYNKPVKAGSNRAVNKKKRVSWSQGTADRIKKTVSQISSIMEKPNIFPESDERLVGTDELVIAAEDRNLFYIRSMKKELYLVSPYKEIGIQRSQTTRVPTLIHSLTDHKQLTKDFLHQVNLPVPEGNVFSEFDSALEYLNNMGRPVVVKPAVGLNGSGVTVDVRTKAALKTAWEYAKKHHEKVVLEELVEGVDIRVVVIGGKARAALLRIPANVIGDGVRTIEQLLEVKNNLRLSNPRLCKNLIIPDAYSDSYLERQGFTWHSVPSENEVVFLHLKANICKGADGISITESIHSDLMCLAEESAKAFGIDDYWGIDLMVEKIDQPRHKQRCAIIELNSTANIENVIYPLYGPSFDSARCLIDYIFPEETDDNDYPNETLSVEITGYLNLHFLHELCNTAKELGIKGNIQPKNEGAVAILIGRRHQCLTLLEYIWDINYRKTKANENDNEIVIVDGIQLSKVEENLSSGNDFFVVETDIDSRVNQKTLVSNFDISSMPVNQYELNSYDNHTGNVLNTQLYLCELKQLGYTAKAVYEELLQISNKNSLGITCMKHSNLFSDRVCEKIYPAKKILALQGIPVPRGVRIKCNKANRALDYFSRLKRPCIATMLHPRGLKSFNVECEDELLLVWQEASKKGTNYMLLEEKIDGWHLCIAVIGKQVAGALAIVPTSIKGDGKTTIENLIENKNILRRLNPWYMDKTIDVSEALYELKEKVEYSQQDVLADGEILCLESSADLRYGGETVAIDGYLNNDFKVKAVQAVEAMPGLDFAFVHMFIPYPDQQADEQRWVVSKIDTSPNIAMFHYPWKGEPVDLAKKVVKDLCLSERTRWSHKI